MEVKAQPSTNFAHRVGHELKEYAVVALYLYICFGAILFYKASVLQGRDINYAPYGLAAVKALILAKSMLIGHAAHIGERYGHKPLIYPVLYRSSIFLIFLVALSERR